MCGMCGCYLLSLSLSLSLSVSTLYIIYHMWLEEFITITGILQSLLSNFRDSRRICQPSKLFFWVLIELIIELLGLIIKPFDNQTEIFRELGLIIKPFDTQAL